MGSPLSDFDLVGSSFYEEFFKNSKIKMKDDIIIHSVMFLAFMALTAQGHADQEGEAKKGETSGYSGHRGGGYGPHHGYGGFKSHHGYGGYRPDYGFKSHYGGYGGHKLHFGGYGGHKSHYGGFGGYKSNYGHGGYGSHHGGHGGYGHKHGYGYGHPFGGYGASTYGSGYGNHFSIGHGDEHKDQAHKNTESYEVPEFDHSYADNYIDKVHDYNDAQDDYKTDNLNVKVKWDSQDGKYEYLKSQYGIYPQEQPNYGYGGHYGSGYGGHAYGGYGKPHYGGGYGGYQKNYYGGGYGGQHKYGGGPGYGGYGGSSYGGYQKSRSGDDGSEDAQNENQE